MHHRKNVTAGGIAPPASNRISSRMNRVGNRVHPHARSWVRAHVGGSARGGRVTRCVSKSRHFSLPSQQHPGPRVRPRALDAHTYAHLGIRRRQRSPLHKQPTQRVDSTPHPLRRVSSATPASPTECSSRPRTSVWRAPHSPLPSLLHSHPTSCTPSFLYSRPPSCTLAPD